MFGKKKAVQPVPEEKKEKPAPAYLREDYPYQAAGEAISDAESIEDTGVLYEIHCPGCLMSIRSQGKSIRSTWARLRESGCIGCGSKDLVLRRVNTSKTESI